MFSARRLLVVLLACLALAPAVAHGASEPSSCDPVRAISFSTPPRFETRSYRFASGDVTLGGCLYLPQGRERSPVVVLVAGSDDQPSAADIYSVIHAKAFTAASIGVFAFDKRGLGDSGGVPTGTDFAQRGDDVAAAVRFVRSLPSTTAVGLWGVSQAGWVVPQALRPADGVAFVILVSPAGVSPHDQVAFFIRNLARRLGLSEQDASAAEALHRAVVRYYATGDGYEAAQRLATADAAQPWFETFRANQEWDEKIGSGGRLLTPAELALAWRERPDDFAFYRAPDTFADYRAVYAALDRPTLVVQGSADTLVPFELANAEFAAAFGANGNRAAEFETFVGAEHAIQDGPRVRPAYLDAIVAWAARQFAAHP